MIDERAPRPFSLSERVLLQTAFRVAALGWTAGRSVCAMCFGFPTFAQEPAVLNSYAVPVAALAGRSRGDPSVLARPISIQRIGDRLVVIDNAASDQIVVLDAATAKTLGTFGKKGSGPGEYRGPYSIEADPAAPDVFWIYDITLRRLTRVDLGPGYPSPGWPQVKTFPLQSGATVTEPRWTAAGKMVAPGFFQSGRLGVFDSTGRLVDVVGPAPTDPRRTPTIVLQQAYQASATMNPARTRVALATRYADGLDIVDVSGTLIRSGDRPFSFEPKYRTAAGSNGPVMASGADMRLGNIAISSTEHFIFVLYSGRLRGSFPMGLAAFGNYLHVFDWEGRLRRVFDLEDHLIAVAASADGRFHYGLKHHPLPAVVIYALPPIVIAPR